MGKTIRSLHSYFLEGEDNYHGWSVIICFDLLPCRDMCEYVAESASLEKQN